MAELPDERQLILEARGHLERWTNSARMAAFEELFEGDEPILSAEDRQLLDALDSALERQGGDGIWGTDEYGIVTAGDTKRDTKLGVVCVFHPQITTDSVLRGADELDDEAEERLNAALWTYSERVATHIERELDAYVGTEE